METYHVHGLEESVALRNFILLKLMYRFDVVPIKISGDYCFCFL